jgi:hypothetical protein
MSTYATKKPFETRPDSGNLFAEPVKKTTLSPDYSGTIAINLKDMTAIKTENGLTIIKLSGWKNVSQASGKTYLALKVNRFVPEEQGAPRHENQAQEFPADDKDIPF